MSGASGHATALSAGALFAFVDGLAVVGIAILMFPLLKHTSEPLALGYFGLRVAELGVVVPRPLAVLGLIGYPALLAGAVLARFRVTDVTQGAGLLAVVPGGLFEQVLPIWLLAKRFRHPVVTG